MKKSFLKVTKDFTQQVNEVVKRFKYDSVLVGIPQEDAARKGTEPINNATILALNEFGSPANHIPPRPVMALGIRKAQPEIVEAFRRGAQTALSKGVSAVGIAYERAGIIASNSVKKVINAQEGIEPPAPATLAARKAAGFKGTKALIVTGQMRNAITYVVKRKL